MNKQVLKIDEIFIDGKSVPCFVYEFERGDRARFPLDKSRPVNLKKGKHKLDYLNIYAGFDIETTNIQRGDKKLAFMYIWQFIAATKEKAYIYLGRTWEDFLELLDAFASFYKVSRNTRIILWVANFSFEFQFLRKRVKWCKDEFAFFAKESRKPLLATCYDGIEFRDCLAITGGSLAQLAKEYCTTQKLVGDLDYTVERSSETVLDREERDYCINDVKILAEFSYFAFETWIKPNKKVPLTKTGILRNEIKQRLKKKCKNLAAYKQMILNCYPKREEYINWFNYLFRGGFVHANFWHTGKELHNVLMYDITSSYPAQMLLKYYPVTPFIEDAFTEENLQSKCCIMVAEFWNIETTTYHSIESKHKVIACEGEKIDNGRIYRANYLKVMLTELDLDNYRMFYRWEKMNILSFKTAKRGELPSFILQVLKEHYIHKAELKRAGKNKTPEYAIYKAMINSTFGLMVTRLALDKVTYKNGEWEVAELALDYSEEVAKQVLLPQWGIYVAAHGRHELLKTVYQIEQEVPKSVAYCDTDSIKTEFNERIKEVIRTYNEEIARQLKAKGLINPAFSDLGMFELEYGKPVDRFKALGAKRYIYQVDGEYNVTVAGLPKEVLPKIYDDPFEYFTIDGFVVPVDLSEKLTTAYNDEETTAVIDGVEMHELSSVALYAIPFSLFTEKEYYSLVIGREKNKERRYLNETG